LDKIELHITGLSYSQTHSGAYALVLAEKEGNRKLPIIIGGFEAQAIAIELEGMRPSRPLTHDLMKDILLGYHINVTEVIIHKLVEGVFFSKLVCTDTKGKEIELDARTSDAIALAVRFMSPIYTHENILSTAGILIEQGDSLSKPTINVESSKKSKYQNLTIQELEETLQKAIDNEAYEEASKIRDEIEKKKKNN
jgi:hypothetical protein